MNASATRGPTAAVPDPRPEIRNRQPSGSGLGEVVGVRCESCGHVTAYSWPVCPACAGPVSPTGFGPGGTVWSSTVVRIPVPGHTPPYGLAYVDLDDGPRVLCHLAGEPRAVPGGTRVRLLAPDGSGDPRVEVAR